ncbi:MAG: ATP-binding protein [Myxococcales bacterium]|nr:ATP-binding protein [Myxococcales bacterium]
MLAELTSLRFLEAHRHIVVLGPVGVGKTFVSQALGHIAYRSRLEPRPHSADPPPAAPANKTRLNLPRGYAIE